MSIAFVSAAASTSGTATAPAGIVAGNFLLAFVGVEGGTPSDTGWTRIGPGSGGIIPFYKWATSSEPASYPFGSTSYGSEVLQYSGVDPTTPVDTSAFAASVSLAASIPAVTTTAAGDVVVGGLYDTYGNAATTPSGMTARASSTARATIAAWDLTAGAAGSYGPWASTLSGSAAGTGNWSTASVALKPAAGAPAITAAGSLVLSGSVSVTVAAGASGALVLAGTGTATAAFAVTAVVVGADVDLSWPAAGSSYVVERDGTNIAWGVTGTSYTDTPGSGEHTYRVGVLG